MKRNLEYNFKINSVMDIAQVSSGIQQIQNQLNGLKVPTKLGTGITTTIKNLTSELSNYKNLTSSVITSDKEFKAVDDSLNRILSDWKKLTYYLEQVKGIKMDNLIPQNTVQKITQAKKALEEYDKEIQQIQSNSNKTKESIEKANKAIIDSESKREIAIRENKTSGSKKGKIGKKLYDEDNGLITQRKTLGEDLKKQGISQKDSAEYQKLSQEIKKAEQEYNKLHSQITKNRETIDKCDTTIKESKNNITQWTAAMQQAESTGSAQAFDNLRQAIANIQFGGDISKVPQDLQQIKNVVNQMTPEALAQVNNALTTMEGSATTAADGLKKTAEAERKVGDGANEIKRTANEVERLASQVEYFFGLQNIIYLFKDAIRQAFETVKELDQAMTETAVVTDFSVGDMWEALPKYTAAANELGTTTLGAYETMTLYYQQGLKTNEVFEIGTETMKMAR